MLEIGCDGVPWGPLSSSGLQQAEDDDEIRHNETCAQQIYKSLQHIILVFIKKNRNDFRC